MARRNPRRGFTLIELVLVLMLLAVAFAMVAPQMRGFREGQRLEDEIDRLLATLNAARNQAVTDGMAIELTSDDGTSYATGDDAVTLPDSITLTIERLDGAAASAVQFGATGEVTPAVLTLTDADGRQRSLAARGVADPFRVESGGDDE